MSNRTTAVVILAALVGLAALTVRMLWLSQGSETRGEALAFAICDATVGWLGWEHRPIDDYPPSDQADWWLAEIDGARAADLDSAELAMGAALILDEPGRGYRDRLNPGEADAQGESEFETKCSQRCLELARIATQLEPRNPTWWRLRAILQFTEHELAPRSAAWLDVLEKCARHDADNALYDYLAAHQFWTKSVESEFDEARNAVVPRIKDAALFAAGSERFERGQQKPFFENGSGGVPAVMALLNRSQVARRDL